MEAPAPGHLIANRYRLIGRLGGGRQGSVWEAVDTRLDDARVALKLSSGPEARRESHALFRLEHPSLPRAIDCGPLDDDATWLVMERVEGVPLARGLDASRVAVVATQVAEALAALHDAGLVHGDVKPANVVVGAARASLVDLGLSAAFAPGDAAVAGTLRYMAPEILAGERGPAGDLFALGVTLFECLAGEHPFAADPDDAASLLAALASRAAPRAAAVDAVPAALRSALVWLVQHDPERRPPSARAWLGRWCRDAGLDAPLAHGDAGAGVAGNRAPLVGRDAERAAVTAAVERALAGESTGVVVVGPPGSGRRRVVDEAMRAHTIAAAARGAVADVREELPAEVTRPTVVVLIDADEDRVARAADAIARTRRFAASPWPVALVATCTGAAEAPGLERVQLHPLDRSHARELLSALHGAPVPPAAVDAWIDATAGLPGRMVSVAQAVGASRVAQASRDELFQRAALVHRASLPDDLDARGRLAGAVLAVAAAPVARAVLARALDDDDGPGLAALAARGLVRDRGGAVSLALATDPAALPDALRAEASARLSAALAAVAPGEHALRARAAFRAGDAASAWSHAERAAADPAVPRAEAVRLLELTAGGAPDASACALRLARTLLVAGEAPRALEALADAGRGPEARVLQVDALRRSGAWDRARDLAAGLADDADPTVRAIARLALARDALDRGDPAEAERRLGELAEATGVEASLRPRALETGALVAMARGDLAHARDRLERADALALAAGDGGQRARVRSLLGMLAQRRGDHDAARRQYRDAWALACGEGDAHAAATYMVNLGGAELECGALGEALAWLTRATRALASLGRMPELARAQANVASLLAWIGDRPGARAMASRAREAASLVGDAVAEGFATMTFADAVDDGREAGRALVAAAERLTDAGDPSRAGEARARAAVRLLRAGAPDEARAALEGAGDGALVAVARVELALQRRAVAAEVDRALAEARAAVADDPAAEHEVWLLRAEAAALRARDDRKGAARAAAALRARVGSLAATLPPELGSLLVELHGPRGEAAAAEAPRDAARWRRLVAITRRLNEETRLRALFDVVMDSVVELTSAARGFLLLRGDDGELRIRAARNIGERDLAGDDMAFSRSVAEHVARAGEALVTLDASADGRFNASASVASMQLRSILAVPLRVHGEVVGTVYVDDRFRAGAFDEDAVEVARAFADAAAVAIHNARTRAELQRALRRAERLGAELEKRVDAQRVELEAVRQTLSPDATRGRYDDMVGRGPAMTRLLALVDRVAPTAMPVLLQGESGTGKELVARAIHANSARTARPFVAENCGAIPETLLESVLFGHVKGAFTGADRNRPGLFEVADGGTLFLDEVGEMSPAMQAKLLRVVQEGEVRPVGGERSRKVDVRVIAATHRDLQDMVRKGTFREDLYYRLAVMVLPIPPLRDRREDIPGLVAHMLARHAARPGSAAVSIDRKALARLVGAPWPGNVRQLENEIQRAAVLADGIIREEDLNALEPSASASRPHGDAAVGALDLRHAVSDVERELVERALREHGWNQSRAARALGLSRFGLQKKLKRLGIPTRDPRGQLRVVK